MINELIEDIYPLSAMQTHYLLLFLSVSAILRLKVLTARTILISMRQIHRLTEHLKLNRCIHVRMSVKR